MTLKRFDVVFDHAREKWLVESENKIVVPPDDIENKDDAIAAAKGASYGAGGGTVRIHNKDGEFDEERTYPRSADPAASPG
jgi:hypothetical protein